MVFQSNNRAIEKSKSHSRGFTLVEMLVVIGIIAVLIGTSIGGYAKMTKAAEKTRAQELVANTATALTALFNKEGVWPQRIRNGASIGRLNANVAYALASANVMSLTTENSALAGLDRFGIVTPWATAAIKRAGTAASLSTPVGSCKVMDHILYFAVDLDGDGIIETDVGGESVKIRATAAVWCIGKSGGNNGQPWAYTDGLRRDNVYSWTRGQVER